MNSFIFNVATCPRQCLPRISQSLFLLHQKRFAHRDAALLISEKPGKPASLWMEFVRTHRSQILQQNPHLRGNDRSILGMVKDRFNALTPKEKSEVEEEYEKRLKDYYLQLDEWNTRLTPEEKVALRNYEGDLEKHSRDKTRKRLIKRAKKRGVDDNEKLTDEPKKPGGVFVACFLPSLHRPEGQTRKSFLEEAGVKWKNLPEEEAKEFWRRYFESVEEYETRYDAWLAEKKAEDPAFDHRKSRAKGGGMTIEEKVENRLSRVRRGHGGGGGGGGVEEEEEENTLHPDLSFDFDENAPVSIFDETEAFENLRQARVTEKGTEKVRGKMSNGES